MNGNDYKPNELFSFSFFRLSVCLLFIPYLFIVIKHSSFYEFYLLLQCLRLVFVVRLFNAFEIYECSLELNTIIIMLLLYDVGLVISFSFEYSEFSFFGT